MANDESISNILPKDVKGRKYFKALGPLLERLHEVGKERDKRITVIFTWISTAL